MPGSLPECQSIEETYFDNRVPGSVGAAPVYSDRDWMLKLSSATDIVCVAFRASGPWPIELLSFMVASRCGWSLSNTRQRVSPARAPDLLLSVEQRPRLALLSFHISPSTQGTGFCVPIPVHGRSLPRPLYPQAHRRSGLRAQFSVEGACVIWQRQQFDVENTSSIFQGCWLPFSSSIYRAPGWVSATNTSKLAVIKAVTIDIERF